MARKVIVGPLCAGKSTYLWVNRGDEDLAVDFDRLSRAFGNAEPHAAYGIIGEATFRARLSAIRLALESDEPSWIIHGNPNAEQITEYVDADCEFFVLDPGLDECLRRAEEDGRPEGTEDAIRAWYEDPPTFPDEAMVTVITDSEEKNMTKSPADTAQVFADEIRAALPRSLSDRGGSKGRWYEIRNKTDREAPDGEQSSTAEIFIYGEIGWDVGADSFARDLAALDVDDLHVHINSPGGLAWDGVAIMNALRRHKAKITATVDGIAASAASIITMGADHIVMNRGSELMIHDAWGFTFGNATEMEKAAEVLHKLSDSLADIYAARAGGGSEKWRAAMRRETWYSAEEAVEAGLADEWVDAPAVKNSFDLSIFAHAGRAHAPSPHSSLPAEPVNRKGNTMPDFGESVRHRLGIAESTDDDAVLAALEAALTPSSPVPPEGAVMIDAEVLQGLREDAAAGRAAREEQAQERRERILQAALSEGRITPASAGKWRTALEKDEEGTRSLLADLAPNTVPVEEIGHAQSLSGDEALYALAWGKEGE